MSHSDFLPVDIDKCIDGDKLDGKTTDGLFAEIERVRNKTMLYQNIRLNFGDIKFVSASGLAWLIAILCGLSKDGFTLQVTAPNEPEVCAWLEVMQFFNYCQQRDITVKTVCVIGPLNQRQTMAETSPYDALWGRPASFGDISVAPKWAKWRRMAQMPITHKVFREYMPQGAAAIDREQALLEITPIASSSDVSRVTFAVVGRLANILQSHLGYDDRDVHNVSSAISEACHNIYDHSGGEGVVVAQRHTSGIGIPFVAIGVADAGVGIRKSLSRSHPEMAFWTHERAIRSALQKGVSGRAEEDRGLGLPHILHITRSYGGRLQIRSGDTRVSLADALEAHPSAAFPGTQLCLSLSRRTLR